jgi:hypothetical protein
MGKSTLADSPMIRTGNSLCGNLFFSNNPLLLFAVSVKSIQQNSSASLILSEKLL